MAENHNAIPTRYAGVLFRSRLEARWAAFFDLVGWTWEYEPLDLDGWTPTFLARFPCGHSECGGHHTILCEVQPFTSVRAFEGRPGTLYPYGHRMTNDTDNWLDRDRSIPADASAVLGYHPRVSDWEMAHGAGGGEECVDNWIDDRDMNELWNRAGELVMHWPTATG